MAAENKIKAAFIKIITYLHLLFASIGELVNISEIIKYLITVTTILFIFVVSSFMSVYIYNAFVHPKNAVPTNGEYILSLLGIMLAFLGLIGVFIYKVIKIDIYNEIYKLAKTERVASSIETRTNVAYTLYTIAKFQNNYMTNELFNKKALECSEKTYEDLRILEESLEKSKNKENYMETIISMQNDYLYYLTKNQKDIDSIEKERIMNIKNELWKLIVSGEAGRYYKKTYELKETCAYAMYYLGEKQKACKIIKSLKGRSPDDWYNEIIKEWKSQSRCFE